MESTIITKENGIATIKLNRPDKYNSVTKEVAMSLQQFMDDCKKDAEVRCVVITGEGKAFSAGQDLQEYTAPDSPDIQQIVEKHYNPLITKIREIEKPVIAAVNGLAAGAGANLALACDIVIAKESVYFLQAFSKIGLVPDSGGTFFLPRLVGLARATALTFLGDKVSAKDAVAMGMIYKAVPDDEFETEVGKVASKLASMPTKGLGLTKQALNKSVICNDFTIQLGIEEHFQDVAAQSEDHKEGVAAFLEKRKPTFTGN